MIILTKAERSTLLALVSVELDQLAAQTIDSNSLVWATQRTVDDLTSVLQKLGKDTGVDNE